MFKSLGNEFLSHLYRKMRKYIVLIAKKLPSPDNKFLLHAVGAIGKLKTFYFIPIQSRSV